MRLWSLHPRYLDPKGLVALWREGLLAQAVLRGQTNGYAHHPQLVRFSQSASPVGSVASYLRGVHDEATHRGYDFDAKKISRARWSGRLTVSRGQVEYEWEHLRRKLSSRNHEWLKSLGHVARADAHPMFRVIAGGIAEWEKNRS